VAALIGVPLGAVAARRSNPVLSSTTMALSLLGISLPSFFLAAVLQTLEVLSYRATGFRLVPFGGYGRDAHLVLPVLVLPARPLAHLDRITYATLRDIHTEDCVRTARAKGLPERVVLRVHEARNPAVPLLTAWLCRCASRWPACQWSSPSFGWPGIGAELLDAIRIGQAQAVAGMALAPGLTSMLVNLTLDLLYRVADPRLRGREI